MAILVKGTDFSTGDQVTATNLDNLVDLATFDSGAVDNSTTQLSGGAIIVKDGGITSAKLATNIAISGTLGVGGNFSLTAANSNIIGGNSTGSSSLWNTTSVAGNTAYGPTHATKANDVEVFTGTYSHIFTDTGLSVTGTIGATDTISHVLSGITTVLSSGGGSGTVGTNSAHDFRIIRNGSTAATVSATGTDFVGELRGDTLRIDTAPTASVATASTHKVEVNLNGSTYYLLCTT